MCLAFKCPLRNQATKNKIEENKSKTNPKTYSSAAQATSSVNFLLLDQEATTKILSCMIHAHLVNTVVPGSYEEELNKTLATNNLPQIKVPSNPPFAKILPIKNHPTENTHNENSEEEAEVEESDEAITEEDESDEEITSGQQQQASVPTQTVQTKRQNQNIKRQTLTMQPLL